MTGRQGAATQRDDAAAIVVMLVAAEASASHRHVQTLHSIDTADAARNAADALHHLLMLHGRYPGVIDHAAARTTDADAKRALSALAEGFADEREGLGRLVVAAGPMPSTPGQAETEASVLAQRHAIEMLAQSDRQGCAAGAAFAVALDWLAIRRVLAAASRRFGIELPTSRLVDADAVTDLARKACSTAATERAMMFGAQQIVTQHRGLWDLLEARARARIDC